MRTSTLLAAILLSGSAQAASDNSEPYLSLQQMAELTGTYQLDNGVRVDILVLDDRLYIDLPRQRRELVLVAPGKLVSPDGAVIVEPQSSPGDSIRLNYRASGPGAIAMRPMWQALRGSVIDRPYR